MALAGYAAGPGSAIVPAPPPVTPALISDLFGLRSETTLIHFGWYRWPLLAEQHMTLNASLRTESPAAFSAPSRKSALSFPGSGSNSPHARQAQ